MYLTKAMQTVLAVIANHANTLSLREIAGRAQLDADATDMALDRLVRGGILVDEVAADSWYMARITSWQGHFRLSYVRYCLNAPCLEKQRCEYSRLNK